MDDPSSKAALIDSLLLFAVWMALFAAAKFILSLFI